jgi:hypothetical protein
MSFLTKRTIQKLAVLHAISRWRKGAYGMLRLQKTLFFADEGSADQKWRVFTFKRWKLGQYSDEVADSLNGLQAAGRISTSFDGPSQRIEGNASITAKAQIRGLFRRYFAEWDAALGASFQKWAYLTNDQILTKAHDDPTYKQSQYGEIIAESGLADFVDFENLSESTAESLTDLVDPSLDRTLRSRLHKASKTNRIAEDWRSLYFHDEPAA